MNENQTFGEMMKSAIARLEGRAPADIAAHTGFIWNEDASTFRLRSLGREIMLEYPGFRFQPQIDAWHQLVILHYMFQASGVPPKGTLMSFGAQPGGMVRGGGFDRDCEERIRSCLGMRDQAALERACVILGGRILPSNADLCAEFAFLPFYPLTLKIWFADEELDASGRMFLDGNAPHYLSVEDSVTAGMLILDSLANLSCMDA